MKITYVASATTVVEHAGIRVLTDPWLTDGIYYGAWHHNPPLTVTPEDFHGVNYLYLSHIHQDHTDLETLKRLDKRTVVLLAPYADPFLRTMLEGRGFPVRVLRHLERMPLGPDFTIEIVPADNCDPQACSKWIGCPMPAGSLGLTHQIDSLAVFFGGGKVAVNVNDCPYSLARPALDEVRHRYGRIDVALTAYSGAGPWPQCFPQLSVAERDAAATAKRDQFIGYAHQTVAALGAPHWIPFAGQYTLGGRLAALNPHRGVPEVEQLPDHPGMVRLNRGAWWDCRTAQASAPFVPRDLAAVDRYTTDVLADRPLAYEMDEEPNPLSLDTWIVKATIAMEDRLRARGLTPDWTIDVRTTSGQSFPVMEGKRGTILVTVDGRFLVRLLRRKAHWNAAEIGSHLTFWRHPNAYERAPYHALSYLHI